MAVEKHTFKILFVGNGGVGKSTVLNRYKTGKFDKRYIPTTGAEVHPLIFKTNKGDVTLNIWDCAGDHRYRGLEDGYYIGADAAIIFFAVTDQKSYDDVKNWYKMVRRVLGGDAPVVLCGNKTDVSGNNSRIKRVVKPRDVRFHIRKNISYYDVSSKSHFEKVFLNILRSLLGEDLNFC